MPYQQYNPFSSVSSTPSYIVKQNLNGDSSKFNVGYKIQDAPSNKVKKEYGNNEYLFAPEANKRPQTFTPDFTSFEDYSSTASPSLLQFPFTGQLKPNNNAPNFLSNPTKFPPTASSKVFIHPHDKPHIFHDVVGHYITDVAGHKLKHVGEALESGAYTEPIIHKLSFAKAALLQLLAIIGPLSAIKTIHFVAKASEPHEPEHLEGIPPIPFASDHVDPYPPHSPYPPTLVGMILHFVAQLSKFNTEAKLHLIPNLLRIVSGASSSSAHASGHGHH